MHALTTYIIPVRIEHPDRERNLRISVSYLLKNTNAKIIIKEADTSKKVPDILEDTMTNTRISYMFEEESGLFHRTKYLNDMLEVVDTPITCNYDCDVILHPRCYESAEMMISSGDAHVVYPYPFSMQGQVKICLTKEKAEEIIQNPTPGSFEGCDSLGHAPSRYGHCVFVNTDVYKQAGGENEEFISWGPEDEERALSFKKLGLIIGRLNGVPVYHIEHFRGDDSSKDNPEYLKNSILFEKIEKMSEAELKDYIMSNNKRSWVIQ